MGRFEKICFLLLFAFSSCGKRDGLYEWFLTGELLVVKGDSMVIMRYDEDVIAGPTTGSESVYVTDTLALCKITDMGHGFFEINSSDNSNYKIKGEYMKFTKKGIYWDGVIYRPFTNRHSIDNLIYNNR